MFYEGFVLIKKICVIFIMGKKNNSNIDSLHEKYEILRKLTKEHFCSRLMSSEKLLMTNLNI